MGCTQATIKTLTLLYREGTINAKWTGIFSGQVPNRPGYSKENVDDDIYIPAAKLKSEIPRALSFN